MSARPYHSNPRLAFALCALLAGLGLTYGCGDDSTATTDGGPGGIDGGHPVTDAGSSRDAGMSMRGDGGTSSGPDGGGGPPSDAGPNPALPTGDMGIASRYPGDVGIDSDPDVIFADDFESYGSASDLWNRWYNAFGNLTIARDAANVHAGSQSLEMTLPQQDVEFSNGVQQAVSPELDVLFLRWYAKIDTSFDVVGSSHNGGGISAHYFDGFMSTPGVPADGTNKYLIEYECWRGAMTDPSPGNLNIYIYWPEQRTNYGDHFFPNGDVMPNTSIPGDFGPDFVSRPNVTPQLGRWYEYEVMLKANTPGLRDGRVAMWLDGALVADFQNLRLRDVASLTIDRFGISFHAKSNTSAETHKWVDDVVAARSYIGPMVH